MKIEAEDKATILLNSLLKSFSVFVDTMKYAMETLSLDDVLKALKSKGSPKIKKNPNPRPRRSSAISTIKHDTSGKIVLI